MGIVKIKALGPLTRNIPEETEVEITSELSAFDLVEKHFGIPRTESRMTFIINGRMQKGCYLIQAGDEITVLKMGGAG